MIPCPGIIDESFWAGPSSTLSVGVLRGENKWRTMRVDVSVELSPDAGSIPAASTIFRRTTRLSGVARRRDECPKTPYFQRVWAFLTSFPLRFPPAKFVLFRRLSFSVWPEFSVPSGLRPNLVQTG